MGVSYISDQVFVLAIPHKLRDQSYQNYQFRRLIRNSYTTAKEATLLILKSHSCTELFQVHQEEKNHTHMEENNNNPPRVSRSKDGPTITTTARSSKTTRFATVDDGGGDLIECSGKHCRSCIAGLIADCVALCCCPCAVLHCFALAFVKAPWVVGRRCLGFGNKKNKAKGQKLKRKCKCCKRGHEENDDVDVVVERNKEGDLRVDTNVSGFGGEVDSVTINAAFEAEKVWLELCQIGHLDFGRVSSS